MQQRDVVAPAARGERVERRPRLGHARRPQRTVQPPRLRRRAWTSSKPALAHRREQARHRPALVEVADAAAEEAPDLVPAGRDRASEHRQADVDPEIPRDARRPVPAARRNRATRRSRPAAGRGRARAGPRAGRSGSGAGTPRSGRRTSRPRTAAPRPRPRPAAPGASRPRARAAAGPRPSISGLWSTPTTAQPFCRTSSSETAAVPQATSSTVSSGPTGRRETRNRRQRGSWPNESAFA